MRVNPAFAKTGKTLVFQKNQEKDVWHALLSFQGTGSSGLLAPADDAVPPAFRSVKNPPPIGGTFSLSRPTLRVKRFSRPAARCGDSSRSQDPEKEPETLKGGAV